MKVDVTGAFHVNAADGTGYANGVKAGQIVEVPDEHARRYCAREGIAEPVGPDEIAHY